MLKPLSFIPLLAFGASMLSAVRDAVGCGLCDPEFMRKVSANIDYPDALHVEGRVWAAQKAGRLPKPDIKRLMATGSRRKLLDSMTLRRTVESLKKFSLLLREENPIPITGAGSVAVLLVDEMMWNRFTREDGKTRLQADVKGAEKGDTVIATETVVVMAIATGAVSFREAVDLGVLRIYDPAKSETVTSEPLVQTTDNR